MVISMAKPTLVDTDILIDAGRAVAEAVACLKQTETASALATSVVTQMELIVGCRDKKELRAVKKFLKRFEVVKLDAVVSDKAVQLLESYRLSHGLLIADAIIAASAVVFDLPFKTKNQRDYRFIKGLNLLPYP